MSSRSQEQVEQRCRDIDTAIAALKAQIAVLEAEKGQLHNTNNNSNHGGDNNNNTSSSSAPGQSPGHQGGGGQNPETSAEAEARAAMALLGFPALPSKLRDAKSSDGCATLTAVLESVTLQQGSPEYEQEVEEGGAQPTSEEINELRELMIEHAPSLALDLYGCQLLSKFLDTAGVYWAFDYKTSQKVQQEYQERQHQLQQQSHGEGNPSSSIAPVPAEYVKPSTDVEKKQKLVKALIESLAPHVKVIALINHGSRLLQRVAECSCNHGILAEALINACLPFLVELASEANGSHLLLRFVGPKFATADRSVLYQRVSSEALELARSRHGCGFLQRAIESCAPASMGLGEKRTQQQQQQQQNNSNMTQAESVDQLMKLCDDRKASIIKPVLDSVLDLVRDPFGNYVVQFILDSKNETHIEHVVRSLLHHIAQFACNKFGSNVIEKCVRLAQPDVRQLLIDEITDPSVVQKLVTDEFANYVIQTAIVSGSDAQFLQIQSSIRPFLTALKTSPHGAKIESRMTKRVKDMQRAAAATRNHQARTNAAAAVAAQQEITSGFSPIPIAPGGAGGNLPQFQGGGGGGGGFSNNLFGAGGGGGGGRSHHHHHHHGQHHHHHHHQRGHHHHHQHHHHNNSNNNMNWSAQSGNFRGNNNNNHQQHQQQVVFGNNNSNPNNNNNNANQQANFFHHHHNASLYNQSLTSGGGGGGGGSNNNNNQQLAGLNFPFTVPGQQQPQQSNLGQFAGGFSLPGNYAANNNNNAQGQGQQAGSSSGGNVPTLQMTPEQAAVFQMALQQQQRNQQGGGGGGSGNVSGGSGSNSGSNSGTFLPPGEQHQGDSSQSGGNQPGSSSSSAPAAGGNQAWGALLFPNASRQ